jgi:ParB/RepB/Spo0J family partition protein
MSGFLRVLNWKDFVMSMTMSELDRTALDDQGVPMVRTGPSVGSAEERAIEVGLILADRNHRRPRPGDAARLASLGESLRERGMLQAVGVAVLVEGMKGYVKGQERYRLLFGARRLEAARSLKWTHVPARLFAVSSDAEVESLRAVENLHRQDISAIEEAQAVSDVIGFYLEQHGAVSRADAIRFCAEHTGQTEDWVRNRDYFERLTPKVRAAALEAEVPATHLRELATVGSETDQWRLLLDVVGVFAHQAGKLESLDPAACKDKWVRDQLEGLREAIDAGAVRYMPIRDLRKRVAESRRKLRSVKWDLSLVVLSGKDELPACDGCPKNSATEPGLFGLDESPAVKDATCGDAACFKAKGQAAEKARAALLKSFAKKKAVPSAADVKVKLALGSVARAGLDEKKAVGFVQREVKKRVAPDSVKHASGSGGGGYGERKLTKHEVALNKFCAAYNDWLGQAAGAIWGEALKNPADMAALLIFQRLVIFDDWRMRQALLMETPTGRQYGDEQKGVPKAAEAVPKELEKALACFEVKDAWARLVEMELDLEECVQLQEVLHVEVAERLAKAFGAELPVMPRWEDFDPAAKVTGAGEGSAPAEAGRPGKKKVSKKKVAVKKVSKKKGPARKRVKKGEGVTS